MKSYVIMLRFGKFRVIEKRSLAVVGSFETREEAVSCIAELKASAKASREASKAAKKSAEKIVKTLPLEGTTKSGKQYRLYGNCGLEERSRSCYTLYINGECVFTSGTASAALEYINR